MEDIPEKEQIIKEYGSEINEAVNDLMKFIVDEQKKTIAKKSEHSDKE